MKIPYTAPSSGLGMAITKNIVDMMGGEISVKSTPRLGTEVIVRLEFKTEPNNKIWQVQNLSHKSAVVVDPDMEMSDSLCRMLKRFSISATFASDIDGALQVARDKKQDGSQVSLFLIGYDGVDTDFLENVRKLRRISGAESKILVLTEFDWIDVEEQARIDGVNQFVSTPLFASDFRLCLKQLFDVQNNFVQKNRSDLRGRTALLVEDNEASREITKLILSVAGISVVTAENGEKAVETLR